MLYLETGYSGKKTSETCLKISGGSEWFPKWIENRGAHLKSELSKIKLPKFKEEFFFGKEFGDFLGKTLYQALQRLLTG